MADIKDDNYIIGHGPYPSENDTEKKDFHVLQGDMSSKDAYFYFDSDLSDKFPIVVKKDKPEELDYWQIKQSETAGNYRIKPTKGASSKNRIGSLDLSSDKIRIYTSETPGDPRVLITDGTYRLRFDYENNTFISVTNSEPLESGDYHYLAIENNQFINFKLTTPDDYEGASWKKDSEDKGLELPEKAWIAKMKDDDGNYSFSNIYPKGYSDNLGPIGKIYKTKNDQVTDQDNPYANLYRLYLSRQGLPANLLKVTYEDIEEFAEYAFMGYRVSLDEKTYFIDKNARFTISEDDKAIELAANLIENDKLGNEEKISIPFNSDIALETEFKQLSAPLYYYINPWEGVLDVERGISAKELKNREYNDYYDNQSKLSPLIAEGRVFFPDIDNLTDTSDKSAMTMDRDINDSYRTMRNVSLPGKIEYDMDVVKNQMMFNRVYDQKEGKLGAIRYNKDQQIISNELKSQSIAWLKDNPDNAGVLKYDIGTNNDEAKEIIKSKDTKNLLKDEVIVQKISPENINTENIGVDFIDMEKTSGGISLSGILNSKTNTLSVTKYFENVTPDQLEELKSGTGNNDKFHIDLYLENDNQDTDTQVFDDILYSLSFNRVGEKQEIEKTPYPELEGVAQNYWDIERVGTRYRKDPNNKQAVVLWSFPVMKNLDFRIEENNVYTGMGNEDLYVSLDYSHQGSSVSEELEASNKITYDKTLNTNEDDMLDFTNHYSTKGALEIQTIIVNEDGIEVPIKGREFNLIKDGNDEPIEHGTSSYRGTISFSDLDEGVYKLIELNSDETYKDLGEISFEIKNNNDNYLIENGKVNPPNKNIEFIKASSGTGGRKENVIKIKYETEQKNLVVRKTFNGLSKAEIMEVLSNKENDFEISIQAYKNGKVLGEKILSENEDQDIALLNNQVSWLAESFETDKGKIPLFKKDGTFNSEELDYITVMEVGYDHKRYPVVKRQLIVDGKKQNSNTYPYKLSGKDNDETIKFENTIEIENIYTSTFDIQLNIQGRDYKNQTFVDLQGMGFKIYGAIDESEEYSGVDLGDYGIQYQLKKPIIANPDPNNEDHYAKEFLTNEYGQIEIYNLSTYVGNKYYLVQTENPDYPELDSAYYDIEKPLEVEVVNEGGGLTARLSDDYSIDGKYDISFNNDHGSLIINIDFNRTNYRLPETGGQGTNHLYKVGTVMAVLATTLLIYKNKKIKRRRI